MGCIYVVFSFHHSKVAKPFVRLARQLVFALAFSLRLSRWSRDQHLPPLAHEPREYQQMGQNVLRGACTKRQLLHRKLGTVIAKTGVFPTLHRKLNMYKPHHTFFTLATHQPPARPQRKQKQPFWAAPLHVGQGFHSLYQTTNSNVSCFIL